MDSGCRVQWTDLLVASQWSGGTAFGYTHRCCKALSRALKAHARPADMDHARRTNAFAKAQKRASDEKWRERERQKDAQATAEKRANDTEWRERERHADAQAKAWKRAEPQRVAAWVAQQTAQEAAQLAARKQKRRQLQVELMEAAHLSSRLHDVVAALAKLWAAEWPACVQGDFDEQEMVESIALDDAEYVMNLADHCQDYIDFVEALPEEGDEATTELADVDRVWRGVSLCSGIPESERTRFVGLTMDEAQSLEDACVEWVEEHVVYEDDPVAAEACMLASERFSAWTCDVCSGGCVQATGAESTERWSCEECNWTWDICTACSGFDNMRRAEELRKAAFANGEEAGLRYVESVDDPWPMPSQAFRAHPHSSIKLVQDAKLAQGWIASTGESTRMAAARARGLPFVKAEWICQPIPMPPEGRRSCVHHGLDCSCWGCRWARSIDTRKRRRDELDPEAVDDPAV